MIFLFYFIEVTIQLNINKDQWFIGNIKHTGFYRVNYDEDNWKLLIDQLKQNYQAIHEINRAALIDDSFNLGRAETIPQTIFLDLIAYLENEDDSIPWTAAFDGLSYIGSMLSSCNDWTFTAYKVILFSVFFYFKLNKIKYNYLKGKYKKPCSKGL